MLSIIELRQWSLDLLNSLGLPENISVQIQSFFAIILILILSWYLGKLAKWLFSKIFPIIVFKTKNTWDDALLDNKFFAHLSYYIIGGFWFYFDEFIASEGVRAFSKTITGTYFTIITVLIISSLLNTAYDIYKGRNPKEKGNLKIYIQLIKVVLYSFAVVIIISFFANKNLIDILKGLGAMATILLIVYKDTILGFVAGISLSANKMLEVGDWISLPQHHADGNVLEIGLNTVKVQNWDMTITTIPTYKLISEAFINWKGMEQSGGRRIKRSINIDIDSIHFLSQKEIEKFEKFHLLKDYIKSKKEQIESVNLDSDEVYNQRRLTNIGTFKRYIENYLHSQNIANENMTFIVRQLQSTERGLPIEVYFFSKEKSWAKYEQIQADVFDHIFAITKEFDLRIFQNISASSGMNLFRKDN